MTRPSAEAALTSAPTTPLERGAYPIVGPWFAELKAARAAHGLDASDDLVAELMSSPDSQAQTARYGVILKPEEEVRYRRRQELIATEQKIVLAAEDRPGYAGSIVNDKAEDYRLTLLVKTEHRADFERLIAEHEEDRLIREGRVQITNVKYSIDELSSIANVLNGGLEAHLPDKYRYLESALVDIRNVVNNDPKFTRAAYGYSMRNNALVASIEVEPGAPTSLVRQLDATPRPPTYVSARAPEIIIRSLVDQVEHHGGHNGDSPDDQGSAVCGRWWCGAPRGGHHTDLDPGGNCTWAGAIRIQLTRGGSWFRRHLTAGHCGDPDERNTYFNFAMDGTGSNISQNLEVEYRRDSSTRIGIEDRNSTAREGEAWGDFSLIFSPSEDRAANNLLMTGLTTYARVTSLAAVSVGTRVCISVPHTSNPRCDDVDDIGFTKTIDGKDVINLAATRGSYEGRGGDSGGPLYREGAPNYLVGVHQGAKRLLSGRNYQVFSRVSLIDNSPNLGINLIAAMPTDGRRDFIQGLYFRALNRVPDRGGFLNFRNHLSSCTLQRARDVGWSILLSTEFKNRHRVTAGSRTAKINHAHMRIVHAYRALLGRNPDPGGMTHWLNHMIVGIDAGQAQARWSDVVFGLIHSQEFRNRVFGPTASVDGPVCR